jgi:hypothetical protein
MGFALFDPSLAAKPPTDLPQARVFPGAGLVAMHSSLADPKNDAYLVLRSSPFGSISHGHADQNAFCLEAFGEALAIPSGYYPWYGSPHHENWTRETKAKNCITLDGGIGQTKRSWEANGRIVRFVTNERFDYALADATAAYSGRLTKCLRHVIHLRPASFPLPPGEGRVRDAGAGAGPKPGADVAQPPSAVAGVFVIVDELEAPKPVTFEWWLHALEEMKVDEAKREVLIRRGDARLLASFVEPQELAFTQTDKFDPPPEDNKPNQWHLTASTKAKAQSATFLTVLRPHRASEEGALPPLRRAEKDGTVTVAWTQQGAEHQVSSGPEGISLDGLRLR